MEVNVWLNDTGTCWWSEMSAQLHCRSSHFLTASQNWSFIAVLYFFHILWLPSLRFGIDYMVRPTFYDLSLAWPFYPWSKCDWLALFRNCRGEFVNGSSAVSFSLFLMSQRSLFSTALTPWQDSSLFFLSGKDNLAGQLGCIFWIHFFAWCVKQAVGEVCFIRSYFVAQIG